MHLTSAEDAGDERKIDIIMEKTREIILLIWKLLLLFNVPQRGGMLLGRTRVEQQLFSIITNVCNFDTIVYVCVCVRCVAQSYAQLPDDQRLVEW